MHLTFHIILGRHYGSRCTYTLFLPKILVLNRWKSFSVFRGHCFVAVRLCFPVKCYSRLSLMGFVVGGEDDSIFRCTIVRELLYLELLDASFDSGDIGHCGGHGPHLVAHSDLPSVHHLRNSVVARHSVLVVRAIICSDAVETLWWTSSHVAYVPLLMLRMVLAYSHSLDVTKW